MISLSDHISSLSKILISIHDETDWENVYDWLHIASSVEKVSLNTTRYNDSFGWCSASDEYDLAREDLLQETVTDLTVFNFIWGALEAVIDIIKPPKHPNKTKRGKIQNTCHFLKTKFTSDKVISFLSDEVENFKNSAELCLGHEKVQKRFKQTVDIGLSGIGMFAVYELRNTFAHGSLSFPEPDEENQPISEDSNMIQHASRVVLLSIQLLLLAVYGKKLNEIEVMDGISPLLDIACLETAIQCCHLETSLENPQMSLVQQA